jgi:surfeit locus 1 family protein
MSLSNYFNAPRPVPWLFFIAAFGLTIALGTWQVNRLAWKEGIIAEIAAANEKAPLTALPKDEAALPALQFAKVSLKGAWLNAPEFHLSPRYYNGKLGYWIIAPFKLTDGRILLVNRGWVPSEKKMPETRPETRVRGAGTITGLVRVSDERNYFTPDSQPTRNVWFGRDVAQMAEFGKLQNVLPLMVDVVGQQDKSKLPVPSDGTIKLKNDHLAYIITWYGIALGILIIFVTYHRKK